MEIVQGNIESVFDFFDEYYILHLIDENFYLIQFSMFVLEDFLVLLMVMLEKKIQRNIFLNSNENFFFYTIH